MSHLDMKNKAIIFCRYGTAHQNNVAEIHQYHFLYVPYPTY